MTLHEVQFLIGGITFRFKNGFTCLNLIITFCHGGAVVNGLTLQQEDPGSSPG